MPEDFRSVLEVFQNLPDLRTGKTKRHYCGEVIFIALVAMICGMDGSADFDGFERFAKLKEPWLRCALFNEANLSEPYLKTFVKIPIPK